MRLVALNATGQVSGAERVLLRTLAAAVRRGWDVECLCPDGPLAAEVAATGARHRAVPELGLADGPRPAAAVRTVARWGRAARTLRRAARDADVVLVNSLLALPTVRLAAAARSAPAVWLAHDVVVAPSRLRLYRACRAGLARVVGVSEAVAVRLRDDQPGGGPEVTVVHNGVARRERAPRPAVSAERPPVVGLNGLLTPWKGQHVLLDALWMIDRPVRVELMGGQLPKDADYAASVRARLEGTRLGERATVLGHQSDPLGVMAGWTVAVSASTDPEACPLNVLEAMSIGVPVVASDHGGSPEVLDGAGVLVPPGDAPALAAALVRLLDDAELRDRHAVLGLERVRRAHDADRQADALLGQLETVAGSVRQGGAP